MKNFLSAMLHTNVSSLQLGLYLLIYRVTISLSLFFVHGLPKIADFDAEVATIPDPVGIGQYPSALIGVFANLVCPLFICMGLFTRAFILPILSITLIGYFIVHSGDPAKVRDVPFMYSVSFILLLFTGPGWYSLDALLMNKIKKPMPGLAFD